MCGRSRGKSGRRYGLGARSGAVIVASCKPIKDDDSDPPCIRAKREYVAIVDDAEGRFYCTGEYSKAGEEEPMVFTVTSQGVALAQRREAGSKAAAFTSTTLTPLPHGAT